MLSGVAVHAAQKVVDTEIGDYYNQKGCYHVNMVKTWLTENTYRSFVERYSIYH